VDYEASLLGNIVIGRATGGLTKVAPCAYQYEWLDISDPIGEANAFFTQIQTAIDTYRHKPERHRELIQSAMSLDASWDTSALQYLHMYQYGLLRKKWDTEQQRCMEKFINGLKGNRQMFTEFFLPGQDPYRNECVQVLYSALHQSNQQ
jgi:hypothetical protein